MRYLLEEGKVDMNKKNGNLRTALHGALILYSRSVWLGRHDYHKGLYPDIPLHDAASRGRTSVVKRMIERDGVDVKLVLDGRKNTALHLAAEYGRVKVVRYLTKEGHADVNQLNYGGETALHSAAANCQIEGIKLLIRSGADANTYDQKGNTPIWEAVQSEDIQLVKLLLEEGNIDPDTIKYDSDGKVFGTDRVDITNIFLQYFPHDY